MTGTSWDDHGRVGVSTLDALVEHDILRIVLSTITENKINDVTETNMASKIDETGAPLANSTNFDYIRAVAFARAM